jgi:hypothetical protein
MSSEALPIVVYSTCTELLVPPGSWPRLYASLQALKGHIQEYPGCQRFDVYFRAAAEEAVSVHCYTSWDTLAQLEAFRERGYRLERLLEDFGDPGVRVEREMVMEKIF